MAVTSGDLLTARLDVIRSNIAQRADCLFKLQARVTGGKVARTDRAHLAMVAVFEAFLELGGDPENPDAFFWEDDAHLLEHWALLFMRREVIGRNSITSLYFRDSIRRKDGHCVDQYRWDAWQNIAAWRQKKLTTKGVFPSNDVHLYAPERDLFQKGLADFRAELKEVVSPFAYRLIVERYYENVPVADQVRWVEELYPQYKNDYKRACNFIDKTISRAKKKAALALEAKWGEVARAVGAAA
jgi:hypothetical protein